MRMFTEMVDVNQTETVKNFTIEILMDQATWSDLGEYKLMFNVSDMYNYTEFEFTIELINVTPVPEAPPVPELPPKFIMPVEVINVNFTVNETNAPVSYILPESFDYNFDPYSISFNSTFWEPWAHILTFDG